MADRYGVRKAACSAALFAVIFTGCSASRGGASAAKAGEGGIGSVPSSFAGIAGPAKPAVVNVSARQTVDPSDLGILGGEAPPPTAAPLAPQPGDSKPLRQRSLGSGFLISDDGLIVTNDHVVTNADEVHVRLAMEGRKPGDEYPARVVGSDPKTDLAVLKIEAKERLPSLRLGDSNGLQVGDWVVAIGNPFGLDQTVTAGIVSATGRALGQGPYDDFIQTDAPINPGNSGGPLLNLEGEVVGITSAIFSDTGGNLGISFATPSNLAREVIDQLREGGKVIRGWLGVSVQDLNPELAHAFRTAGRRGALVADVEEGSPAASAGIQQGDVIFSFEGRPVDSSRDFPTLVAETPIGKTVPLALIRDGRETTVSVRIGETPEKKPSPETPPEGGKREKLGLSVEPLTPKLSRALGIRPREGVLVGDVEPGSLAEEAGILPGDIIQEINREAVRTVHDVKRSVEASGSGESLLFLVQRGESSVYLAFRKP